MRRLKTIYAICGGELPQNTTGKKDDFQTKKSVLIAQLHNFDKVGATLRRRCSLSLTTETLEQRVPFFPWLRLPHYFLDTLYTHSLYCYRTVGTKALYHPFRELIPLALGTAAPRSSSRLAIRAGYPRTAGISLD